VNAGPWQVSSQGEALPSAEQASDVLQWSWDLTSVADQLAPLRPGDLIRTRVVAIDRKGQHGASPVREYLISDQALDARRRANAQAWADLAADTDAWHQAVVEELIRLGVESRPEEATAAAGASPATGDPAAEPDDVAAA